jgi:hypothetical protein
MKLDKRQEGRRAHLKSGIDAKLDLSRNIAALAAYAPRQEAIRLIVAARNSSLVP